MQYFGRVYRLDVGNEAEVLTVNGFPAPGKAPAQIRFSINQTPNALTSYAEITVFGLNRDSRASLYKEYTLVNLVAGYAERHSTLFRGYIQNVEIGREGPESFVKLYCFSGGKVWDEAYISRRFGDNTPQIDIIRAVAESFQWPVEIIGDFSKLPRAIKGRTFAVESSKSVMNKLASAHGFTWQVENNRVVVIKNGAHRDNKPHRFSATNGLIGSPQVTTKGTDVKILLNPLVRPLDLFEVAASTAVLTDSNVYQRKYEDADRTGLRVAFGIRHEGDFYGDEWSTFIEGVKPEEAAI